MAGGEQRENYKGSGVRKAVADLSLAQGNSNSDSHRMVNPDLAGRALLGGRLPLLIHISCPLLISCLP